MSNLYNALQTVECVSNITKSDCGRRVEAILNIGKGGYRMRACSDSRKAILEPLPHRIRGDVRVEAALIAVDKVVRSRGYDVAIYPFHEHGMDGNFL